MASIAGVSLSEGFSVPLLAIGAVAAVAWIGVAVVVAVARRPPRVRAAAATMELPPESPAVAGLLANEFVVPAEVAPAILLDLAARDVVELDEVQPGRTICRLRKASDEPLAPYEQRVLDSLRDKAIDGIVPTEALTTGPKARSKSWHRDLAKEIVGESKANGLTHDRWSNAFVGVLSTLIAIHVVFVGLSLKEETPDDVGPLVLAVLAVAIAFIAAAVTTATRMGTSLAQLPTDAGRTAASRVEGLERHLRDDEPLADLPPAAVKLRGRHFAYAAAFGAAPLAVELLPMGIEDDHRAWSRFGGRWRRVRVRYPRFWPFGWGRHPGLAVLLALFSGGLAGAVIRGLAALAELSRPANASVEGWRWFERGCLLAMIPFALIVAWAIVVLVRALPDLFTKRTLTGEVVRDRQFESWTSDRDRPSYRRFMAVDDGARDRVVAFRLRQTRLWGGHSQGDTVTVEFTPNLGYVRSITRHAGEGATPAAS